jgi:hypothetical protein
MPSKDDALNNKYICSSDFLKGSWNGKYEKSPIKLTASRSDAKNEVLDLKVWIHDKNEDKEQALIPVKIIPLKINDNTFVLLMPDIGALIKEGNYNAMSSGFLYPVMKIFKISKAETEKLTFQEVIFTKKAEKDKTVKLSPEMKMWGENSNMLYGTSTEITDYLKDGKYRLSEETVLNKVKEPTEEKASS